MTGVSDATEHAPTILLVDVPGMGPYAIRKIKAVPKREYDALAAELEAADQQFTLLQQEFEAEKERAEAAEKERDELARKYTLAENQVEASQKAHDLAERKLLKRVLAAERVEVGLCLNCGSREQTVVCADCGRLNPAEEHEPEKDAPSIDGTRGLKGVFKEKP